VSCPEEAKRLAHETGQLLFDTASLSLHTMIVALRGDNERAPSMASEVERAASGHRLNSLLSCVQVIRGFGLIGQGQHTEAARLSGPLSRTGFVAIHLRGFRHRWCRTATVEGA
jgi:hypothetical protein